MIEIYHGISKLFGNEKCGELKQFMDDRNLVPVNITEIAKIDDRDRYVIKTNGGKIELSDGTFEDIRINVHVTYNRMKNRFRYTEYTPGVFGEMNPVNQKLYKV